MINNSKNFFHFLSINIYFFKINLFKIFQIINIIKKRIYKKLIYNFFMKIINIF